MKIDHFAFEVSNLDASIRFYTETFGFKVFLPKTVDGNQHEGFAILEMEGGRLELIQSLSESDQPLPFIPNPIRPHYSPHLAILVDDFEQSLAMLKERGLPLLAGPFEMPGVVKWLYFCDPDQNILEFMQDLTR